jgi:hypothetical protein
MGADVTEHDFEIWISYPSHSPAGNLWAGHYYKCWACGLECVHPDHLPEEERQCAA